MSMYVIHECACLPGSLAAVQLVPFLPYLDSYAGTQSKRFSPRIAIFLSFSSSHRLLAQPSFLPSPNIAPLYSEPRGCSPLITEAHDFNQIVKRGGEDWLSALLKIEAENSQILWI
ncbi:hypothetical protein N7481_000760 [Penicillium waksmanii]|uniref:uncharacterized protein n=1 Tax=Penicillium waksmanii TaxID=69791 RepID=UPI002547CBC8|nr:uncharacterized protein N7481_000760 [Penicillium waksmanii]KAJ6000351.1 hypothetical protein N7481_000760 [Penicillium waksmanii]